MTKTMPELMKLVAAVSGWGNQSCRVKLGFMPARVYDGFGGSDVDMTDWGWVASVSICGEGDKEHSGQGKTPEEALFNLASNIPKNLEEQRDRFLSRIISTRQIFQQFVEGNPSKPT